MKNDLINGLMKESGRRIRDRRNALGITTSQIKKECGISAGNMSEIENGNRIPTLYTVMKLAQILDCSIDYIAFGEERSTPAALNPDEQRLLEYLRVMNKEEQEEFWEYAKIRYDRIKKQEQKSSASRNKHIDTA